MQERTGEVTMKGNPVTLLGEIPKIDDRAPDAQLVANDMKAVSLSSYKGKVCIISSVPSLDTPTCDMETRKFNTMAVDLSSDVHILTVSTDLPFAQKRWCGAAGVDKVVTLSDHRSVAFGEAYGVLIKDLRLLARAVFVVDREGVLRHVELVKEIAAEPDYDAILAAVKKLI